MALTNWSILCFASSVFRYSASCCSWVKVTSVGVAVGVAVGVLVGVAVLVGAVVAVGKGVALGTDVGVGADAGAQADNIKLTSKNIVHERFICI
jgi:hypothetical protein